MLRGSYSLDGVGKPCCPCARQPSYSSPRSFPRPRRCRTVPPCQATTGKTHGHHRAVRWRPDGSQNTSPRSRRPIDNNPDPRPFIKFSEDPASASPLSSLTLALARELERGNRGAAVACDHGACPVARPASYYVCSHRTYIVKPTRSGCQGRAAVFAVLVGTERLTRTMRLRVLGCVLLHGAVGPRRWRCMSGIFASCCPVCNRRRLLAR